ncbi:sodium:proton antiporter [Candidatus Kaiserbacteria bacterium]|nr:sodium:proton antiporter [Candidatus Kaiserbacteria bacterium]USN91907.1 MAG: sodium:proton antiporter [Candidatus Nomurabacteria bacterium]
MLTIGSTLAIFLMLGISSLGLFLAKRLHLPHTVLLVLIGIGLGFLTLTPAFSFIDEFRLTPELLFYLLLPTLIFESAYQMNVRKLLADGGVVFSLSIGSFLISTALITGLLHLLLLLIDINVPFSITLLFGALISATDPVAVLALFKEYGVPRRLSLIFEGESLFNDATAVAVFLITLEAITNGGFTILTSLAGFLTFVSMLFFGVVFGLLVGGFFAYLVGFARENEVASITLTIVLAHITFIMAEVISSTEIFGLFNIHISPIISTTVASLLMGNYGRAKMNPKAESFVIALWEQFAFMANSLIFILIGVLIVETPIFEPVIFTTIIITILTVALARAISIYPVISTYNSFQGKKRRIPLSWQHLLAWGSLRGALAVTMVFLIPDSMTVPGWNLSVSPKEFLLSITIGCIAATLFIKATTIKKLVKKFKLDKLTTIEEIEYQEARALIHHKVTERVAKYQERGYIDSDIAQKLLNEHTLAFHNACDQINLLSKERRDDLAFRVLRIYAIGIEKRHLKDLYDYNEVTEPVFRRIQGKLRLQLEAIEEGDLKPDVTIHDDGRDVFEIFFRTIKKLVGRCGDKQSFAERYMYYRAQAIISRKVLKELSILNQASSTIFTREAVDHVNNLYTSFKENSSLKFENLKSQNPEVAKVLAESLAGHGVHTIEEKVLNNIFHKELITQKLYITLKEETSKN